MISAHNVPLNIRSNDADFTTAAYRELLVIAKQNYAFASYDAIPWGERFVLWRHDCDFSLNRALALARIDISEGVRATYFLNPHSEFYNLFERSQYRLVREIIAMGHQIGLHFDAAFHDIPDEESLAILVREEAMLLEGLFGVMPAVFSFHNPLSFHLGCEDETYGGLVNCYSRRFKTEVPYCSDSNGYWRFRRMREVLAQATDPCLQVLTHPEWWQESAMSPRQRIFRSALGRARAAMADYDATISAHGRENLSGAVGALAFLRDTLPERYALLDFLWMSGEVATLFVELWRLHESQLNNLCKAVLCKEWGVSAQEVNAFFESHVFDVDGLKLFTEVFGCPWHAVPGIGASAYPAWAGLRTQLVHGRTTASKQCLEEGSVFLCDTIASLAAWGKAQPIGYDGLVHLDSIGQPVCEAADEIPTKIADGISRFSLGRWELFKAEMGKVGSGEAAT